MSANLSAQGQGLPELGNPPTGHRAEDYLPAEVANYARRKWMWALSDMTGVKALRIRQGLDQPEDQAQERAREPGWMLFGRIGPLRWQNELGEDNLSALRFGLQHAPPRLSGQAYIGIYRKF